MLANSSISLFCIVGAIYIALLLAIMVIRWLRKETVITDHLPCNLSETGSMVYYAKHTSGDGDNKYCFNFRKTNNAWLAYIVRTPDFNDKSDSTYITHRVYDKNNSSYFISWDRPVDSLKDIQTFAKVWAGNMQKYIEAGKYFGE